MPPVRSSSASRASVVYGSPVSTRTLPSFVSSRQALTKSSAIVCTPGVVAVSMARMLSCAALYRGEIVRRRVRTRWLLLVAVPVLLVAAAAWAVLGASGVTLSGDEAALASIHLQTFAGSLESARATTPAGKPVPLAVHDGRLTPKVRVTPGERIDVEVVVRRPGALSWALGDTRREHLTHHDAGRPSHDPLGDRAARLRRHRRVRRGRRRRGHGRHAAHAAPRPDRRLARAPGGGRVDDGRRRRPHLGAPAAGDAGLLVPADREARGRQRAGGGRPASRRWARSG